MAAESEAGIARRQAAIARYGITQARAGFLPQATIGNVIAYNSPLRHQPDTFSYVALNGVREYSSLATIGIELDTSGRLRAQLARARSDRDAADAAARISERDLKRAVAGAYYRVLLARHLVEVARDNLSEARAFENRTRLLADAGEAAEADVIKAAAQAAAFEQAVNASSLEAKLAEHDLAAFWTADVDAALPLADELAGPIPAPEAAAPAASPFLGRLEFKVLDAQKKGLEADARRARAELVPQLSLAAQYGLDSTRFTMADRGYAGFLHLNVPVFDWFRSRSAARQFELQAGQIDSRRRIAERSFAKEYRDALTRVDMLYSQIAIAEKLAGLSADNLRLARVRYEGGEGSALDVVTAQTQLAQARSEYFAAKASYLNARADLEVAAAR